MTQPPSSMVGDLLREADAAGPGIARDYAMAQASITAQMLVAHQLSVIAGRLERSSRPVVPDRYPADPETENSFARRVLDALQHSERLR